MCFGERAGKNVNRQAVERCGRLVYVQPEARLRSWRESWMMNSSAVLSSVLLFGVGIASTTFAYAENKYNQYTGQWENVSPDAIPQMNPITGKWELAPPGSAPKLNPYTNEYHMVPPNAITRYNPYTKQWELAPPDATLELNRGDNTYHYTR
jgi:hypothetical protein